MYVSKTTHLSTSYISVSPKPSDSIRFGRNEI